MPIRPPLSFLSSPPVPVFFLWMSISVVSDVALNAYLGSQVVSQLPLEEQGRCPDLFPLMP